MDSSDQKNSGWCFAGLGSRDGYGRVLQCLLQLHYGNHAQPRLYLHLHAPLYHPPPYPNHPILHPRW